MPTDPLFLSVAPFLVALLWAGLRMTGTKVLGLAFILLSLGGLWALFQPATPALLWGGEGAILILCVLHGWYIYEPAKRVELTKSTSATTSSSQLSSTQISPTNQSRRDTLDSSKQYPRASLLSPSIPANLTGPQATKLITNLREYSKDIQLKVCSTQEHIVFTKELVDAFRAAGYTFIIDEKRNESIFLAQPTHNKILFRYREDGPISHSKACSTLFIKFTLVFTYETVIATDPFPEESTSDYCQIEIGGAP